MKKGKFVVVGLSLFLVVAIAIAVIAGAKKSDDDDSAALSSTSKAVASVCSQTDHKKTCVDSLSSLASNQSATPKDFLEVAIKVTIQEVQDVIQKSQIIGQEAIDPLNKMAVEDCKELLQYAVAELQASFSSVGDSSLHTITDREIELKNWLSAVMSYQQSCVEGFSQPELKNAISSGLLNASQLTDNALAIVSAISEIITAFNIPRDHVNATAASFRRLLVATDHDVLNKNIGGEGEGEGEGEDEEGYPSWFSSADRHLLATQNAQHAITPNAVVAKDGSGQYTTIAAALAAYPKKNVNGQRYVIYVKQGVYDEYITVTKDQVNVFMYGDGPRKTIVTGRKCYTDGVTTFKTATFSAIGNGFIAMSMGFQNTAGPQGHQAVALRVQSDMSAFYNCSMDGYQDTLYAQAHRQFYRNCVISGTIDFIFGDSTTLIQNCLIIVRRPMDKQQNTVTAHGRYNSRETTGLVIQNCRIVPEQKLEPARFQIPTYLGRPWKAYSRTIIMETTLADFIQPGGWMPWAGSFALDTLHYAEYANRGPGASTDKRVKWRGFHVITNRNEAFQFTAGPFIQGDQWLRFTGAPYFLGLKN